MAVSKRFRIGLNDLGACFQVSTWFANARRRLKKDNKMTWTPRGSNDDDSSDCDDDNEKKDDVIRSRDNSPLRHERGSSLSPVRHRDIGE